VSPWQVFKREMNLIFHMTTHRPRQPQTEPLEPTASAPVTCQDCGKVFATKYQAKKHYLRRHFSGDKPFACSKCGKKKFVVKEDLTMHMKSCGNVYLCKCGIRLCSLGALKRHCKYFEHEPKSYEPEREPSPSERRDVNQDTRFGLQLQGPLSGHEDFPRANQLLAGSSMGNNLGALGGALGGLNGGALNSSALSALGQSLHGGLGALAGQMLNNNFGGGFGAALGNFGAGLGGGLNAGIGSLGGGLGPAGGGGLGPATSKDLLNLCSQAAFLRHNAVGCATTNAPSAAPQEQGRSDLTNLGANGSWEEQLLPGMPASLYRALRQAQAEQQGMQSAGGAMSGMMAAAAAAQVNQQQMMMQNANVWNQASSGLYRGGSEQSAAPGSIASLQSAVAARYGVQQGAQMATLGSVSNGSLQESSASTNGLLGAMGSAGGDRAATADAPTYGQAGGNLRALAPNTETAYAGQVGVHLLESHGRSASNDLGTCAQMSASAAEMPGWQCGARDGDNMARAATLLSSGMPMQSEISGTIE
jgi:hypothetical protein